MRGHGLNIAYANPEFIENLLSFSLPILGVGKLTAFPSDGDSMPSHCDRSFIIGAYVERLSEVKNGKTYIIVSQNDGLVYKQLNRTGKCTFSASSNNIIDSPYEVKLSDILEIWKFVCSIETKEFELGIFKESGVKAIFAELSNKSR